MSDAMKHRGLTLGVVSLTPGQTRYRVRNGRHLALVLVGGLTPDWLAAYTEWYSTLQLPEKAAELRTQWLAVNARKVIDLAAARQERRP